MLTVEASVMNLVCWNLGVSARWVESRKKMKNKFANDLLGTLECNDMSRLVKMGKKPLLACKI